MVIAALLLCEAKKGMSANQIKANARSATKQHNICAIVFASP